MLREERMNDTVKKAVLSMVMICLAMTWASAQGQFKTKTGVLPKPIFRLKPNLCIETAFSIGKQNVLWGDNQTVTLTPKDAHLILPGRAAFNLHYLLKNLKDGGVSGFRNDVLFNDQLVSQQTNLSVGKAGSPEGSVPVWTQMYLPIQNGILKVKIDAGGQVDEEWEGDNEVWIHVRFAGF